MLPFTRLILFAFVVGTLTSAGSLRGSAAESEYKAADTNLYLRAAVLKADPHAVILDAKKFRKEGDSYFLTPKGKAPHSVYLAVMNDWLEPVTPPNMPASLGVAPNVMQIREPQGDVQVSTQDGPSDHFVPATEGMPIANGTEVRTGADGTAAVLFGGVNSARLMPNSQALVQQTVTAKLRMTRIDLKAGTVFSKVGLRRGDKQDYEVFTPHASIAVKGTDFACVALPDRTDVYLAQGTVQFFQLGGKKIGTLHATGKGELQVIRYPHIADAHAALQATAETVTSLFNFIPKVDLKIKTLRDQQAQGIKLGPAETKYLSLIREIPCLQKLDLVPPPVIAAAPASAPVQPAPSIPQPAPMSALVATNSVAVSPTAPLPPPVASVPATNAAPADVPIAHGANDTAP